MKLSTREVEKSSDKSLDPAIRRGKIKPGCEMDILVIYCDKNGNRSLKLHLETCNRLRAAYYFGHIFEIGIVYTIFFFRTFPTFQRRITPSSWYKVRNLLLRCLCVSNLGFPRVDMTKDEAPNFIINLFRLVRLLIPMFEKIEIMRN